MSKAKKKITRILAVVALAAAALMALPVAVMQLPFVQNFIRSKIESECL